jgi:hypothetical protein
MRASSLRLAFAVPLFAAVIATAEPADESESLRKQYAWFQSLPATRQMQLRQLHDDFTKLEREDQVRLTKVMQNYNAWLSKLPAAERQRIADAATADERFRIVAEYKETEWVLSLPKSYREQYAKLDEAGKAAKLKEWRSEENERSNDWSIVRNNWKELAEGRVPPGFNQDTREKLEQYVANLRTILTTDERNQLDAAKALSTEAGGVFPYLVEVVKLTDRHQLLPGKVGPKDFASLPGEVRETLLKDKHFRVKKGNDEIKELKRSAGRWPEYAEEVTRLARLYAIKIPPLGDCRKEQMPDEVKAYMTTVMEPQLKKTDAGRGMLDSLQKLEGQWPEYPQRLLSIVRDAKLPPIPGWTLPGPDALWNRFRPNKMRPPTT